jgi:hypothetical protein
LGEKDESKTGPGREASAVWPSSRISTGTVHMIVREERKTMGAESILTRAE